MNTKRLSGWFLGVVGALSVVVPGCGPAPASSATQLSSPAGPEQVVESFYEWYVGYPANALVDKAYRSSEYLSGELVQKVDEIVASFDKGGYDPFLCAQDVPGRFTVDDALVSGEEASVVVHEIWNPGTEYELVHDVEIALRTVDGAWKIADVVCVAPEAVVLPPEVVVEGFYDWYLGYIGNPASGQLRNPLVDGAYRSSAYLTEEFVQKVDEIVASFDRGGYDPFLCAQDIPASFTVDAAVGSGEEATVVVHEIWNPGTEFESVHDVTVTLRMVDGVWKIGGVACEPAGAQPEDIPASDVPVDGWQVFSDGEYGFQMRYPAGWTYEDVPPVPAGMEVPEGMKALKRLLIFAPQGWDGVAPPFNVEVLEGTEEECARVYAPPSFTESVEIGDRAVIKAVEDLGEVQMIRYVFQSPVDGNVQVVVTDYISGFPERADGNEAVIEVIQQMLSTVEFK